MKNVAILGSTGSIGRQALDVVRSHPDRFALYGVSAHSSEAPFLDQIAVDRPRVAVFSRPFASPVSGVETVWGDQALYDASEAIPTHCMRRSGASIPRHAST